jgi:hypothetical protein
MKRYRYAILLFLVAGVLQTDLWAQSGLLKVEIGGDSLRISANQPRFLTDKTLDKLHKGLTVTLVVDLTIVTEPSPETPYHVRERFAFSFDLWEEKYSVFQSPPDGRYVSHLSAASAEEWCLQNISIPLDAVPDRHSFMIQLECIIEENGDGKLGEDAPGFTIAGLIEYFSRKKSEGILHWKASTGLLRFNDLKQQQDVP